MTLYERVIGAQALVPVETEYRVVYEDPDDMDQPVKVLVPAPEFMAQAMQGGILPEVDAYIRDREFEEQWRAENPGGTFSWHDHGGATQWFAPAIGALTEEEAIEYLVMKDIPRRVWQPRPGDNRVHFRIVRASQIPSDRTFRDAWRLA